jgi:hypothetical protein
MNGIQHHPIGRAALAGIQMTPRDKPGVNTTNDDRRMDALAALEPADDPELAPLVLEFTDDDIAELRRLAEDLADAVKLATQAEQRHTAADRIARTLPHLLDRSGQLAAKAFRGTKADKDALAAHNVKVDECREAEAALKTLTDEMVEASRFKDGCFGRLRVFTNKAMAAMRQRAAAAYAYHAESMRKCLAAVDVSIELQAHDRDVQAIFTGWHCVMGNVRVPAMPQEFRGAANGVEHHSAGGDMLVSWSHSYLTFQQKAIRSRLQVQIADACASVGLRADNLL